MRDRDGYVYPRSLQASSVAEALALEAEHLGVSVLCGCRVTAIRDEDGGFAVETEDGGVRRAGKVILAAGSKAASSTGSDGSGYELARSLGHRIVKPLPALVQLVCRGKIFKQLAGIRAEARVVLLAGGRPVGEDRGELQLTDYGISGIPVFQVSRFASVALDRGEAVEAVLDFLPDWSGEETEEFLADRRRRLDYRPGEKFLSGLLPEKLGRVLMSAAGISLTDPAGQIPERKLSRLAGQLKGFRVEVTGTRSFDSAQICCGGVSAGEIDPASMESRLHPGLHLTGELVDVDGICGGYNLQWAWSTGILAGRSAAAAERRVGH